MKNLLEVKSHKTLKISQIDGGQNVRKKLSVMGIGVDSSIKVIRNAPFAGPLIIEHAGSQTAIGRGIAAKIQVEELE
ncbi:MAG TPA: FeoA domain-containing protein [bacterium]|nr:FeoA domain-containing protein [bacterium]